MKKSEIVLNGKYANQAGTVRKVIAMCPEYVLYRVLTRGAHCTGPNEGNSTRTSFAAWAKEKVK